VKNIARKTLITATNMALKGKEIIMTTETIKVMVHNEDELYHGRY
jgi:hypothetical protein